jgi:hypothetical protein
VIESIDLLPNWEGAWRNLRNGTSMAATILVGGLAARLFAGGTKLAVGSW